MPDAASAARRKLEGGEFVRLPAHEMWRDGPVLQSLLDQRANACHRRQDHLEGTGLRLKPAQGLAEGRHQALHLARPAAGQHHEHGAVLGDAKPPAQSLRVEASHPIELLDQRMADIAAGGPAKAPMRLGLEGQNGEDVIDIAAHLACPAGPPRPDARRDVVDDGHVRRPFAHALCHLVGEFGAIEDHERVGRLRDHGVDRLPDAPPDIRQAGQHVNEAHDGDVRRAGRTKGSPARPSTRRRRPESRAAAATVLLRPRSACRQAHRRNARPRSGTASAA